MLVGEVMRSKRVLILTASALFLMVIIVRALTLMGDSESRQDGPPANQTSDSQPAAEPARTESGPQSTAELSDTSVTPEPSIDENSGEVKAALPLFRKVGTAYLRGQQPARGGVDVLAKLGVKTIVDLRSTYDRTPGVAAEADRVGLRYYSLPLSVWNPPTDAETAEFLAVVSDKSRGPVFVFCTDGVNRTGEMTAIYRIAHDRWTVEDAVKEMDEAGFSPYYYSLRNYVWAYSRTDKVKSIHQPRS